MEDCCELCGIQFSAGVPRYHVGSHVLCKKCKEMVAQYGSIEKANKVIEEKLQEKEQVQKEKEETNKKQGIKYDLVGSRGKCMKVFTDKVIIHTEVTFGSLLTQNATDGDKTIYYVDVIGFQFKRSGLTLGYLQLETASGQMNNKGSNFFGENSFVWEPTVISDDEMEEVANYIRKQVDAIKTKQNQPVQNVEFSAADEIMKLKGLLDMGILTQEEFDAKKKQLLGI